MVLFSLVQTCASLTTQHYVEWFPGYSEVFQRTGRQYCSENLSNYFAGSSPKCDGSSPTCLSHNVVSCILGNSTENVKSNTAAASVVLGLLPSVLSMAGSNSDEMGILAQHRPVLSFLLSLGSPVMSPMRAFEFPNPLRVLDSSEEDQLDLPQLCGWKARALSVLEYCLAMGAMANIIIMCWEIGVKAVCGFSADSIFLPLVWALTTIILHGLAALSVRLRLRVENTLEHGLISSQDRVYDWFRREGRLCMLQSQGQIVLQKKRTFRMVLAMWCTSTGILLHLVFGTLVLSSTLFVATIDALAIAGRVLASVIICRAIVFFEIRGLKGKFLVQKLE